MRSFLKLAVLFSSIALITPAHAEDAPQFVAPVADLSTAPAGTYKIDPGHTNVFFRLAHLGYSGYMGRFDKIEGTLELDPKAPDKSLLNVTIDPTSINTNNDKLEAELRSAAFEVEKFPAITFKSTKLVQKDSGHGEVTGDLTLHGITKPVTLTVTLNGAGTHPLSKASMIGFSAIGSIKRTDFGVVNWLPMVGDDVQIIIETEMQHQGPN